MPITPSLFALSEQLGQALRHRGWQVAAAESCTGGGIAAAITATAGSSQWFEYGLVSYANSAKQTLLGVTVQTLAEQGAVSKATVSEMVNGLLNLSGANVAVASSGIAGPSGGTDACPVGTVWLAWGRADGLIATESFLFEGDRHSIQQQAVEQALLGLLRFIQR